VKPFGAPAGTLSCYIEVPFQLGDRRLYPDGLIRVSRGSRHWSALVEVKTGSNLLQAEQLENYLDIAREQGFDAVITISNEIPAVAGQHPPGWTSASSARSPCTTCRGARSLPRQSCSGSSAGSQIPIRHGSW